ncbi:MAG: hypothetical protein HYX68_10570 [Planctomycetes bacterium]|nr:hypothetical protein [Planctomycetota bacterium]
MQSRFFIIPYLTGSIWPKDPSTLYLSIATASTLVSATILCLVNFFWHSRDQKRIHTLRSVLKKNRDRISEAEAKLADAQRRAASADFEAQQFKRRTEEVGRQSDEERKKAEEAHRDAEEAAALIYAAHRSAHQAQLIAEREKRWRTNRALLVGHWERVEFSTRYRTDRESELEVFTEAKKNRDILVFGADDHFIFLHPGQPKGFLEKIQAIFQECAPEKADFPIERRGRWSLNPAGDTIQIAYSDGKGNEVLKVEAVNGVRLIIDKSNGEWEQYQLWIKIP